MAQWMEISRNKDLRKENTFEKGVDTENNAFFISDNAYSDGYGWDTDLYPAIATRKGRTSIGVSGGARTRLLANFGNRGLLRIVGTKAQAYSLIAEAWSDITTGLTDGDWDATNFDINGEALIITTTSTTTAYYWQGIGLTPIPDMPKGAYVASDNRRVYTAGVGSMPDSIYYCAFQDVMDWTSPENSGIVQFYTSNGGPITGLHAFEGQIYAFKRDAFAQIFHTGDARITHRLVEVSNDIGCYSYKTIKEVGSYLLWLGNKDVFMCAGGTAVSIGDPVKRILENINLNAVTEACAWVDDYRYYLCIPTGSNTTNDTELVYDTRYKVWHIRSINLGGMRFGTSCRSLPYGGWDNGMAYRLNSGTTDAGTPIPYKLDSKVFDEGVGDAEKEYYELRLQGYVGSGATMTVGISTDDRGSNFTTLDTITPQSVSQNKNIIVPMDAVPLTHFMRYRLSGTGYVELNKIQRSARVQPFQI